MVRKPAALVAAVILYAAALVSSLGAGAQLPDTFFDEESAPAVAYVVQQPHDPVAQLNDSLANGSAALSSTLAEAATCGQC